MVVRGQGSSSNLGAAVSILGTTDPTDVKGLVRFVQLTEETCLIDVSVSGVDPGKHAIVVHQYGDFTNDWESCGGVFKDGVLGEVVVGEEFVFVFCFLFFVFCFVFTFLFVFVLFLLLVLFSLCSFSCLFFSFHFFH